MVLIHYENQQPKPQPTMQPFTLTQAAKEAKKAKSTIIDAIRNGRLSASKDDKGRYQIEPVELFRVYPPTTKTADHSNEKTTTDQQTDLETALLKQKVDFLEQTISRLETEKNNLWQRLDSEAEERRRLMLLLTHETTQQPHSNLWQKFFS
jgi:hypothetical protein